MKSITFLFFLMLMMTETFFAQVPPPIETGVSQVLAKWRAANYSDVRYKLNITLEKGAPLMRGEIEIRVNLTEQGAKNNLILDWRTTQFENDKDKPFANVISVNGAEATGAQASRLQTPPIGGVNTSDFQQVRGQTFFSRSTLMASEPLALQSNEHLIIPNALLKTGENIIKIQFASPIKTSGAGLTRYLDKEDGAEYVYSLFVPSDASTAFPVFDQPDLKARFQLNVIASKDWKVVSNTSFSTTKFNFGRTIGNTEKSEGSSFIFEETKPISTYVFAFAAGDFAEFDEKSINTKGSESGYRPTSRESNTTDTKNETSGSSPTLNRENDFSSKIYVRKSQAEKFKSHAQEVFRLNREGVKFLEGYFDYKFPFPKYDLVLIPEFPFGGMEHAGATFLRESSVIFPTEPTKNDYVSRANVIFHEAAHQWFGDTVTMKWFDDLWLKEGFAEFMAYKTLSKVMPEYNAWKIFYERNKQAAYLTDSTRGTTPIYQEIANLSAAKSAYGNIVYRKAPSFLKQAEFYLGEDKFQIAVRTFLKKHEFKNAEWTDLVKEFERASGQDLKDWANVWVKQRGLPLISSERFDQQFVSIANDGFKDEYLMGVMLRQRDIQNENGYWLMKTNVLLIHKDGKREIKPFEFDSKNRLGIGFEANIKTLSFAFPNYQDYGYGIFLLDVQSRAYVLQNINAEKDDFLRTMMWGALWDSVRETELAPQTFVELVINSFSSELRLQTRNTSASANVTGNEKRITPKGVTLNEAQNIGETDESTIQTLLGRVSVAMNYYLPDAQRSAFVPRLEAMLVERIANAATPGQRITFYRAFLNLASSARAAQILKDILAGKSKVAVFQLKTKDKFDIVTRLLIMGDKDAPNLLANLEKTETSDEAKRYAYAARAGVGTAENKAKYFKDFVKNKDISESWIEAAFNSFNSVRHSDMTLQYLETALAELPNLKKNRKIFFVNGWLGAFIGGQRSEEALAIVNKFLADNPNLDRDLRLKILENADGLERAVKIRAKYRK